MISETRALLALSVIPNFGIQRVRALVKQVEHPSKLFSLSAKELKLLDGIGAVLAEQIRSFSSWDLVDSILEKTQSIGAQLIGYNDENYPDSLKQIFDPPLFLWVKGTIEALHTKGIAIVGTRSPSEYGRKMTIDFTTKAIEHGLSIYSGLAYGIDTIAHRTAVELNGTTVAVLGSGIDWIYPNANIPLAHKIIESGGAIISEFLPGTKPDAGNFPIRNRIVSGLSQGVLVVETSEKGGSRITANLALDQNREVFVIPHANTNPNGTGCNELIKKGYGKLVQDFEDITDELLIKKMESETSKAAKNHPTEKWKEANLSDELKQICMILESGKSHIDEISEALNKSTQELLVRLLELEFQGVIVQHAGKKFFLI